MIDKAKRILTLIMVLVVMISSHSFAFYEHQCLITKHKTYSFNPKDCSGKYFKLNKKSKTAQLKRTTCCKLSFGLKKVDDNTGSKINIPQLHQSDFSILNPIFNFDFGFYAILEKNKNIF